MTSLSKNPTPKKRGRPLGSKNKKKPAAARKAFKQPKSSGTKLASLQSRIDELEQIRDRLHRLIDHHEHKEIQYRAVIDYLETKLEIE